MMFAPTKHTHNSPMNFNVLWNLIQARKASRCMLNFRAIGYPELATEAKERRDYFMAIARRKAQA